MNSVNGQSLPTIEFNTAPSSNDPNKDREGDGVYDGKTRQIGNFTPQAGIWIRGFLNPPV